MNPAFGFLGIFFFVASSHGQEASAQTIGSEANTILSESIRSRWLQRGRAPAVLVGVGYKTDGFLEGEPLERGWVMRFGLSFKGH